MTFFEKFSSAYGTHPQMLAQSIEKARTLLSDSGFADTELILNEWNYLKGWKEEAWEYTLKSEKYMRRNEYG